MTAPTTPSPDGPHGRLGGVERAIGDAIGGALGATRRSLKSVIGGVGTARIRKGEPGAQPGIELHEIQALPSSAEKVYVTCTDYNADQVQVREIDDIEDLIAQHRPAWTAVRWINVDGLSDASVIHALARKYDLHPLALEDLVHRPQRPKCESYDNEGGHQARLFVIARMMQLRGDALHNEQISIFLGHNTVLTFQETHGDVWDPIRRRIHSRGSRLRINDASFLVYTLIDAIVDHCFPILEHYGDKLHELEESVLDSAGPDIISRLHAVNRELMMLRRQVWPMRDVVQYLQREPHECMGENTRMYMRDVYDHIVQIIDMIETYHEVGTSVAETYATTMGNKLNEVVKVLTVLTALFTPPTFLASVYGMNFKEEFFPELTWRYSYAVFWVACFASSAGLMFWFKRRHWL